MILERGHLAKIVMSYNIGLCNLICEAISIRKLTYIIMSKHCINTVHVSVCMVDVLTDSCVWLVCDGNGGHCRLFQ